MWLLLFAVIMDSHPGHVDHRGCSSYTSPAVIGYLRGLWDSHFGRVYLLTVPGSFFHAASITRIKKQRHREFALCRCMLYTLYKPLTYYLLFCPVGVSSRRYTLPERS